MERFSADVENRIIKALGSYLRATSPRELPSSVRRFQAFASKALLPHRDALIEALEAAPLRARIIEWLDGGKTSLARAEAELLRTVAERSDGWVESVRASERHKPSASTKRPTRSDSESLERERQKTRRAREDLQQLKAEAAQDRKRAKAQIAERDGSIAELQRKLRAAEATAADATKEAERLQRSAERDGRKLDRDRAKLEAERDRLHADARAAKREVRELAATVARLERELTSAKAGRSAPRRTQRRSPARRTPLEVPKGRLADAPETLAEWLSAPQVHLLVDGYNVTKAKTGFGDLRLESQRERLIDGVGRLARKKAVRATIVFDGAELPGGAPPSRRKRAMVAVEYSRPPEIGDDHLVARLKTLPNDPVVVVTNDRELQGRVRDLGATVATSEQLLRLIR